jgi:uncharacterized protein (DUF111 family)
VSTLALYLETEDSTATKKASVDPVDFINLSYTDMIDALLEQLKTQGVTSADRTVANSKRRRGRESVAALNEEERQQSSVAALSFRQTTALCGKASALRACFNFGEM